MSRFLLMAVWVFMPLMMLAQQPKKPAKPPQKDGFQQEMDKMMEEAMKGLSKEEQEEVRKMISQNKTVADDKKGAGGAKGTEIRMAIPAIQTKALASVPVLSNESQLMNYEKSLLAAALKNIEPSVIRETDKLLAQHQVDGTSASVFIMALFLNKSVRHAVYASLKSAVQYPGNIVLQHNLAFILQQAGYPQKSIAIQKYLLLKHDGAVLNNNLAQSYLSLGDKANARKYFTHALRVDPTLPEAHCGMGLLESAEGRIPEASQHVRASLSYGYSAIAEELKKKHRVDMAVADIKSKLPYYFNPQKFAPVEPAIDPADILSRIGEREAGKARFNAAQKKWMAFNEKYGNSFNERSLMDQYSQHGGYTGRTPFSRKARFMMQLIGKEYTNFLSTEMGMGPYRQRHKDLLKRFENELSTIAGRPYDSEAERCKDRMEALARYLAATKENYFQFKEKSLSKLYDYVNQSLYWQSFLLSGDAYTYYFLGTVKDFYGQLMRYDELQNLAPWPKWVFVNCANYEEELEKARKDSVEESLDCPLNIKVVFGQLGSVKYNCKGKELEGGELLKLSYEKDFESGEFTIAFGLGADANLGVLGAGVKGLTYFRFDKDFMPIDMGMKGEANAEMQVFIFNFEEKITGTMGIANATLTFSDLNKEYDIFKANANSDKPIETILDGK